MGPLPNSLTKELEMTPFPIYELAALVFIAACMLLACLAHRARKRVQAHMSALGSVEGRDATHIHRRNGR
jgi:hypothetical protein